MKNLVSFDIFESKSGDQIEMLTQRYAHLPIDPDFDFFELGKYHDLVVKILNPKIVSLKKPEWNIYKGSHHWGKKTDYIPEREIWIVSGLRAKNFRRILNHEIIEREMMRALEEEKGMDKETAWNQAHFYVKELGF